MLPLEALVESVGQTAFRVRDKVSAGESCVPRATSRIHECVTEDQRRFYVKYISSLHSANHFV